MKARKYFGLVVVLLAVFTASWFIWYRTPQVIEQPHDQVQATSFHTQGQVKVRRAKLDVFLEKLALSAARSPTTQSDIFVSLKEFRQLNSKVLLTAEEKKQLQKQMSDVNIVRGSFLSLIESKDDIEKLPENQMLRMMAIDFLEAGLRWKENPAREQVEESLRHALLFDNLSKISDLEIRKSYAGDKVEAYAILKEHSPDSLKILEDLPEDGRIRKLIKYAEKLTQDK